jgi:tetratricopeptide (TPR) repeat protein
VSADKTVRLWALSQPQAEPRVLRGHEDAVWGVAFSPNGQVLATVSADKTVRLWALSQPQAEPRVLRGHEGSVEGVAFSPDGQVLATVGTDQTVRLWSLVIDHLVRRACLMTRGNFRYKEWHLYMGDEPYRKTCQNRPLEPSFLAMIRDQVKNGDVDGAIAKLHIALQVDGASDVDLQKEARRLAAPGLVERGQVLAKQGAIKEAMAAFAAAQANDPNLEIDANAWNSLCWNGNLGGFATEGITACERAVALKPDDGAIRDSRGVARVLTGDYPGAIEDFQLSLAWGQKNRWSEEWIRQRKDWIQKLQANQNPFNEELLKRLRDH